LVSVHYRTANHVESIRALFSQGSEYLLETVRSLYLPRPFHKFESGCQCQNESPVHRKFAAPFAILIQVTDAEEFSLLLRLSWTAKRKYDQHNDESD